MDLLLVDKVLLFILLDVVSSLLLVELVLHNSCNYSDLKLKSSKKYVLSISFLKNVETKHQN